MVRSETTPLRVLIADEQIADLDRLADVIAGLGHVVVARVVDVGAIGAETARVRPDVALVELGASCSHALALIKQVVHESECPVIALLDGDDPEYLHEAAKEGVFAYIVDSSPDELQSAIEITLRRFAEYHDLQGAFGRRAVIEQAKGILMAGQGLTADDAFARIREHSQSGGEKLAEVARTIVAAHRLVAPAGDGAAWTADGSMAAGLWRAALDALPDGLAVLDADGTIVAVNEAWRAFAKANGGTNVCEGVNYLAACDLAAKADPVAGTVGTALREMLVGTRPSYECFYACDAPWQQRWFWMRAAKIGPSAASGAIVTHHDVTVPYLTEIAAVP